MPRSGKYGLPRLWILARAGDHRQGGQTTTGSRGRAGLHQRAAGASMPPFPWRPASGKSVWLTGFFFCVASRGPVIARIRSTSAMRTGLGIIVDGLPASWTFSCRHPVPLGQRRQRDQQQQSDSRAEYQRNKHPEYRASTLSLCDAGSRVGQVYPQHSNDERKDARPNLAVHHATVSLMELEYASAHDAGLTCINRANRRARRAAESGTSFGTTCESRRHRH